MDSNTVRNITALPPETLANILRFLPARSLVNALLVCRLWKDLAQRELTQRKYFVSRVFKCRKDELTFQIVIDDIRKQILEFLNDIDIVPSAMVMLCYEIFDPMTLAEFRKKLLSKITDNLPKDCIVIGAREVGGIIGETNFGCPVVRKSLSEQLSVLFIPKVENVNVNHFQVKIKEIKDNEEEWRAKLDHLVNKDIKFLFLIGAKTPPKNINCIWSNTVKFPDHHILIDYESFHEQNKLSLILGKRVVVGGGLAKPFAVVNNKVVSSSVTGLAIGGNIEASNVVEDGGSDIKQLLQRMPILNQSRVLHSTACFLTPCVSLAFSRIDEETSQVRKAFPHMKIFGFLGFGEIGTESRQRYEDNKKSPNVLHYYSISLSILKLL